MTEQLLRFGHILALLLLAAAGAPGRAQDDFDAQRREMVDDIAALARETAVETGRPALDPRVIAVLGKVPRHRFVPADELHAAYRNRPLPIGYGQTISQPYIVALMTDLMNVRPEHAVLEIGTGSGYQAAILAELAQTRLHDRNRRASCAGRPTSACAPWAMRGCARGSATAITAGRTADRSTRSSSPPPRAMCPRR